VIKPHRRRHVGALAAAVLAAALVGVGSVPASAEPDPGLWYYNDFGVQEAHDQGYTGQGVKIAVLDGPLNPSVPMLSSANITVHEPSFCDYDSADQPGRRPATTTESDASHGTNMVGLIAGNGTGATSGTAQLGVAPAASILYYAQSFHSPLGGLDTICPRHDGPSDKGVQTAEAIDQAVADGADIISMSFGQNKEPSIVDAVARADAAGVIMVVAISNDGLGTSGLDAMNGVVTVQAMTSDGSLPETTTRPDDGIDVVGPGLGTTGLGPDFTSFGLGGGTSDATAVISGFLAVVKSKYPSATNNQIIQSLILNTGTDDHELAYDPQGYFGYGVVSLRHMLRDDPTGYSDVNPLISKETGDVPSYEQIFGSTPTEDPTNTGVAEPAAPSGDGVALPGWIFLAGGGVLLLLVLTAIVIMLVLRPWRRSASRNSTFATPPAGSPRI
jgi:hypothetical protein